MIVGGGQSGLAAAFGLLRERISNILVIDENPTGFEGPWDTYARMLTLRTPKELTPIDFGVPALTYQAFWEAQYGARGWAEVDKIARGDWMAYLRWYRRVLALPVRNDAALDRIEPIGGGLFRLHLAGGDALLTRKVVLATGIQGGGEWHTPAMVSDALPRKSYAHTSDPIDYAAFAGKRVAILGGGASAFDNANTALSLGVGEVHVFIRRKVLPRINPIRFMERVGFTGRYPALSDAEKYAVMTAFIAHNQPPTNDTFNRAAAWPGFALHLGAPWLSVEEEDGAALVTTPHGRHTFDFLVLSTGLVSDPGLRPELREVCADIARWSDVFTPPKGAENAAIDAHPYLGPRLRVHGARGRRSGAAARVVRVQLLGADQPRAFGLGVVGAQDRAAAARQRRRRPVVPRRPRGANRRLDCVRGARVRRRVALAGGPGGSRMSSLSTHVLDTAHGRPRRGGWR